MFAVLHCAAHAHADPIPASLTALRPPHANARRCNSNPNPHQMKVAELKKALRQHGLKPEGGKAAMAAALSEVEP